MATSGSLIRWYQDLTSAKDLDALNDQARDCPPADILCLPYFLGEKSPLHDPDLRGAFVGLHLGHTRGHLFRAIFEAIAFGFRHHVEVFREIGLNLGRVMITNGGSKSRLWKQIHAEVLGTEMYPIVEHPGASLGAALIAAIGVGLIGSWDDVETFVKLDEPVVPSPENIRIYRDAYARWRELGMALTPISHQIARHARS
jgi:xylulokinase